jgi:MscS family membrane protein
VQDRLCGVDTSTPRSTFEGFLYGVNRAYQLTMQAEAALTATPPTMTKEEARTIARRARNHLQRTTSTLDLSRVPQAHRQDVGIEAVIQLKEVLDRMLRPSLDSVPDALMVETARAGGGGFLHTAGPLRWRYPDTRIEIVEIP